MDSYDWATRFCGLLERVIKFGTNQDLRDECQNAILIYRAGLDPLQSKVPLKMLIEAAAKQADADGRDPYGAILQAIAGRTGDCVEYFTDDQLITQDIRDWLETEAGL